MSTKIVHIKFGNQKLNDFIAIIEKYRNQVDSLLTTHNIINLCSDSIEAVK